MNSENDRPEQAYRRRKFIDRRLRDFRKQNPEIARTFMDFWRATKHKSQLPQKYKELIQLAIVLYDRCESCIYQHIELCLMAGATRFEILDAASQSVAIGGGIVYENLAYIMDALDYFEPIIAARNK
ncbi:carboxymuconolactone decarboxylase family protein [bacterium]|nr:carboxymuconolactone decarboxylase family protein [bacterium]